MKIVFIANEAEPYAIMQFSSILKRLGHTTYLFFDPRLFYNDDIASPFLGRLFDIRDIYLQKILKIEPNYIMFSTYTQDFQYNLAFAKMIKERSDMSIVFGGVHCILCYEEVLKEKCIDYVCRSEGEQAVVDIVEGRIKDRLLPMYPLTDINTLPFPDRKILYDQKPIFKRDYTITTSRGCPFHCSFCASDALNKQYDNKYLRQRSPEHVINELIWAKQFNYKSVVFTDDNMVINTSWLKEMLSLYTKYIHKPFCCTSNPATLKDEQLYLLKDAGCQLIGFGIQSWDEKIRKEILDRYGINSHIKHILKLCHRLGIRFSCDHIFDIPTESRASQVEALECYLETKPTVIHTFTMTYLPKIKLNKYLNEEIRREVEQGKLRTGMFLRGNNYFASLFMLVPLLPNKLIRWVAMFNISFPFWLRLLLKDIARVKGHRWSETFFPILFTLVNIKDNLCLKYLKK